MGKGEGKMRKLIFAALAAVMAITCSAGIAEVITSPPGAISNSWNLFALPIIPKDPSPVAIMSPEYDPGDGSALSYKGLYRWDASNQGLEMFDSFVPESFGNLCIGEGYWLQLFPEDTLPISYEGFTFNDSLDTWVSLPKAGWTIIGQPFSYPVDPIADPYPWADVLVTDGIETRTMDEATLCPSPWLDSMAYWWDSEHQGLVDMGTPDAWASNTSLWAWHGYWVQSYKDNLALIFPARQPG